jgi:thiamine biosynthesis protein ThiI
LSPLELPVPVLRIPFYQLHRKAAKLPQGSYMLFCGRGVMSRLHAGYLSSAEGLDLKVYAP